MGRTNKPILSTEQRAKLEHLFRTSTNHSFRNRCHLVILKADGRTSKDVGKIVGMSHVSVNSWVKRYNSNKIEGLSIKSGRGRKPLIDKVLDESQILEIVKSNRQRLQTAKAEWETFSGKSVSKSTFKRFLKVLAVDTNA